MKEKRMLMRVPVLTVTILMALLLLAGTYTVLANSSPSARLAPNSASAGSPTFWSSGWVSITAGTCQVFTHSLGRSPESLAVDMWFQDTDGGLGINRRNYGGLEFNGNWYGAHWQKLTSTTIEACRQPNDNTADMIRLVVWVAPTPDYDSGWRVITPSYQLTFNHNLGGTATDLTVGLYFSGTTRGIHQYAFGGLTKYISPTDYMYGAHWYNLTSTSVQVFRRLDDTDVEQVRVVVSQSDPPAYDSGWQDITAGSIVTFNHNLNWNPDMLLVRGECNDPGQYNINLVYAGGDHWSGGFRGSNLQNLTANTVQFVRRANDDDCPKARVVIYKRSVTIYLPVVMRDYSSP